MRKTLPLSLMVLTLTTLSACEATLGDTATGIGGNQEPGLTGSGGAYGGGTGSGGSTGPASGSGGSGVAGSGSGGSTVSSGSCATGALPADMVALLTDRCIACHGATPLKDVPTSLTSYAQLTARSTSDPSRTNAQLALLRMQDAAKPMPPAPLTRATSAEIATMQAFVTSTQRPPSCPDAGAGTDGGNTGGDAGSGVIVDPFTAAPTCTSKRNWTGGNRGNQQMNPGMACITCHSMGEGPKFSIAGTLYPTAHEPDLCNGFSGTGTGAQVVIVGANGQQTTLTPNAAGNFNFTGTITKPYKAKVVYMGRERAMVASQTSGDCNSCHTQNGAMPAGAIAKAPGRILLP